MEQEKVEVVRNAQTEGGKERFVAMQHVRPEGSQADQRCHHEHGDEQDPIPGAGNELSRRNRGDR